MPDSLSENLPNLRDAATFTHWTDVTIRFSDQDPNAHVNNTAFSIYAEAGRVDFLSTMRKHLNAPTKSVLASVHIDYINQLHYPGVVRVGTCLTRLGNKSYSMGQGMFKDGQLVATSTADLVFFDYEANISVPVPDAVRQAFDSGASLTGA